MYISGFNSANAILKRPELIRKIFVSSSKKSLRLYEFVEKAISLNLNIDYCNQAKLSVFDPTNKHQGVIVEVAPLTLYNQSHLKKILDNLGDSSLILILDSIQDPRNLGACIRNAVAFGVDMLILNKDSSAPINDLVFKSSVGAVLDLNILQVSNISNTIDILKKKGFWIFGLDGNSISNIVDESFPSKTVLIMGSEGFGIRPLIKKRCDKLLKISILENVESLNISVATGISLYEVNRQKHTKT